jgi:hypothetical protein
MTVAGRQAGSITAQQDVIFNGVVEGHHKINTITLRGD